MESSTQKMVERHLRNRSEVDIVHTYERGLKHGEWAVVITDSDFWLDAFTTRSQAELFCSQNKLPVRLIRSAPRVEVSK